MFIPDAGVYTDHRSKPRGIGGLMSGKSGTLLGAAAGAAGGIWLGHKIGKLTHDLGHYGYNRDGHWDMDTYYRNPQLGHYGYYDDSRRYVRCPPPKVVDVNGTLMIPVQGISLD